MYKPNLNWATLKCKKCIITATASQKHNVAHTSEQAEHEGEKKNEEKGKQITEI
jgi:hypothetical protein